MNLRRVVAWASTAVVAAVIAALIWSVVTTEGSTEMTEGLVPDLEKALADHWTTEEGRKDLSVNLTETVRTRIPIGTTVEDAKAVMQLAGFTVKGGLLKNVPAGMDDGLAGVLVSPIGGAIFADRSFNILLGVKDNRIESIVAWAAFRAL